MFSKMSHLLPQVCNVSINKGVTKALGGIPKLSMFKNRTGEPMNMSICVLTAQTANINNLNTIDLRNTDFKSKKCYIKKKKNWNL